MGSSEALLYNRQLTMGLRAAICLDGIQKPPRGPLTQRPPRVSDPRPQEGRVPRTEQAEFSSVETPSTSPIFMQC